jgi:hypothetical protein
LALDRIKAQLEGLIPNCSVEHKVESAKLIIRNQNGTIVKIEVNKINRGIYGEIANFDLCERAQSDFDAFCFMPIVPLSQLFGGKICAALDRQHPRDLFDVRKLLDTEGLTPGIKDASILTLLSSSRPLHELLAPNFLDQSNTLINQFQGMTEVDFSYDTFDQTRTELIETLNGSFTAEDKEFLMGFHRLQPNWEIHDLSRFPSIKWKLQNLNKFKNGNSEKHETMMLLLQEVLSV